MVLVRRISGGIAAAALWLSLANPALAADPPPYPVWWSPALELDSIEAIDARLARHIWPGDDEGLALAKGMGEAREETSAVNCIELERLVAAGFYGIGTNGFSIQLYTQALCRGIEAMRRAQPAETSYLRDFVLDEGAIHVLPAMVTDTSSCEFLCRHRTANERRIPISRFEPVFRVTVTSPEEIEIRTLGTETDLSILARGDFNDDGLDDLLLLASSGATEGSWASAEVYLLSREAPGSVLGVLEAGTVACTDYHCQETYDYPKVLGETNPGPIQVLEPPEPRDPITADVIGQIPGQADIMAPEDGPPYPVWWWPSIYLQDLEDLDELFEMEFWLTTEGTLLEKDTAGETLEVNAKSCKELFQNIRDGFRLDRRYLSFVTVITQCQALERLKSAEPAQLSYLRDFVLDETVMDRLPAALGFWTSPCVAYEALAYNDAGKSWQRFTEERAANRQMPTFADGSVYHLQFINERYMQAWALAWVIDIEVLAGGDFNGDGLDDILVKRDLRTNISAREDSDLLVLSRDAPDAVLRIVNVEDLPDSALHRMAIGADSAADLPTTE